MIQIQKQNQKSGLILLLLIQEFIHTYLYSINSNRMFSNLRATVPQAESYLFGKTTTDINLGYSSYLICPQKLSKQLKVILFTLQGQRQRFQSTIQSLKAELQQTKAQFQIKLTQKQRFSQKLLNQLSELRIKFDQIQEQLSVKDQQLKSIKKKTKQLKSLKNQEIDYLSAKISQFAARNKKLTSLVFKQRDKHKICSEIANAQTSRNAYNLNPSYLSSQSKIKTVLSTDRAFSTKQNSFNQHQHYQPSCSYHNHYIDSKYGEILIDQVKCQQSQLKSIKNLTNVKQNTFGIKTLQSLFMQKEKIRNSISDII